MLCSSFSISRLAIPSVCALIGFLAYSSQYFFLHFEPAPLTKEEAWRLNIAALCIWITYYRSCTVDPGRIPKDWRPAGDKQSADDGLGMTYLESCLFDRVSIVWASKDLPSYMGPTVTQIAHLFVLVVLNSLTVFALGILLIRTIWALGSNTTTIESWEIERHETLVRRARHYGGYLQGPGGIRVRIKKQEFPYDIGIWSNIKAGMGGSANIISWFWPLARTPSRETGWDFEVNGFEDPHLSWPPPDPDRIPLPPRKEPGTAVLETSSYDGIQAFNQRKADDMRRLAGMEVQRRKRFHQRAQGELHGNDLSDQSESSDESDVEDGEEAWRNSEGERLRDFGVDEEIEFYDEEDIPLGVLMRQRAERQR
ncbi:hypothetical protein HFD88_005028 [Aspergillus terreus]|nr:hypothetical protein HFD88_005028 [Aspergillus terreus]